MVKAGLERGGEAEGTGKGLLKGYLGWGVSKSRGVKLAHRPAVSQASGTAPTLLQRRLSHLTSSSLQKSMNLRKSL